jgi:uncharacterized integral membrane protein
VSYDGPRDNLTEEKNPALEGARRFGLPAIIGLIGLLFVFQNTQDITFEFLWFDFTAPLFTMLVAFALVGAVVLWGMQHRARRRRRADD